MNRPREPAAHNIDITGNRYGNLVAIRYYEYRLWEFQCDCGNTVKLEKHGVTRGKTKCCSKCLKKKKEPDITGKKFNKLTAIRKFIKPEGSTIEGNYWVFSCECGTLEHIIKKTHVVNGRVKSCGCLQAEILAESNRKRYGRYIEDEKDSKPSGISSGK